MTAEVGAESLIDLLSPLEIIQRGLEIERLEVIPLARVLTENALIDPAHADELGASMKQKRGQITPIAVRAKINEASGEIVYDVIDGFHRTEGMRRSGGEVINATVIYGCSDEEMYDLRILAASSVRSVQFPRIAQWISQSWETTSWSKKSLTVSQAFGLVLSDSKRSNIADLTVEEVIELKEWAAAKCTRWGKSVGATYGILRVVAMADPELTRQVRTSGGGKDRTGKITPVRLQAVAERFPGEANYAAQRAILRLAVERRYYAEEIKQFVEQARIFIEPDMSEDEIYELVSGLSIIIKPPGSSKRNNSTKEVEEVFEDDEEGNEEGVVEGWDELEPDEEALDKIERGLIVDEEDSSGNGSRPVRGRKRFDLKQDHPSTREATLSEGVLARGDGRDIEGLRARIKDLEQALRRARERGVENNAAPETWWWRTALYLTPVERLCMERILFANGNLDVVSQKLKITPHQAITHIRSAFIKRSLEEAKREPAF